MEFVVQRSPAAMIKKNKSKDLIAINRRNGKRQVWNKVKHACECSGPAALSLTEGNRWACRWRIHLLKRSKGHSAGCCSHLREYPIAYRLQKSSTCLSGLGTAPGHLSIVHGTLGLRLLEGFLKISSTVCISCWKSQHNPVLPPGSYYTHTCTYE